MIILNQKENQMVTIGNFIKERMDSGAYIRQYELAMELGINSSQLSHYNTGRSKQPTIEVAAKIYKAYDIVIWPYSKEALDGVSKT